LVLKFTRKKQRDDDGRNEIWEGDSTSEM
jgi:hypothetical protein